MNTELKPIKLHNSFAVAKYSMNTSEEKLFAFAVLNIDQNNKNFIESQFNISDFAEYACMDIKRLYKEIDRLTDNVMQTIIYMKSEKNKDKWEKFNLTQKCSYDKGVITFKFNNDMKSKLLQLKKHYFYQTPGVRNFKSKYSIRVYRMLKAPSYKSNIIEIDINDLKTMLEVEKKYSKFSNLKSRVIDTAINEINDESNNCDIHIDKYEIIYSRRIPVAVRFEVTRKDSEIVNYLNENYNIPKMKEKIGIDDEGFNSEQIIEFYELALASFTTFENEDELFLYMKLNYLYTKERKEEGNPEAYFKKALQNDYAKAIPQIMLGYIVQG